MRLRIVHHLGWAVAVTAAPDHTVVDRRRMELIEAGVPTAPIHHEGRALNDEDLTALVADVRASVHRAASAALDELADSLPGRIVSLSLRAWPADFPRDVAVQRRAPYESRADSVMYREVLAELADARGWELHQYDARFVEAEAARIVGQRAEEVLLRPRARLGPPWSKDPPCLVGWGDRDPFFPLAQGRRTAEAIPRAELRVYEGAGHFLPEEAPAEVEADVAGVAAGVRR